MRIVIQRVKNAKVDIGSKTVSQIKSGALVFLGIEQNDTENEADYLVSKLINLRFFEDESNKMNLSIVDLNKEVLAVSQFTLYGDCRKGRRPSFSSAMPPDKAKGLYDYFVNKLNGYSVPVKQGVFGAKMEISLINDGPVTFIIDSI